MLIIGNGRVITWNPTLPYMDDGAIAIEEGAILAVGETKTVKHRYPDADYYDAKRRVVMPGLINTHTHIYSSFARGLLLPQRSPNRNFMDILANQWWRIDKMLDLSDCRYSAYATGIESIRLGVTTLFDHHASQQHIEGSLFAIEESLHDLGLRASLCYEVSDRDGKEVAKRAIQENVSFIDHAKKQKSPLSAGMFGLHASFTLSDATLNNCVEAMGSRDAGYHIHVAEAVEDQLDCEKQYGKRVVKRLYDAGILGEKTLSVHNVHIKNPEIELLQKTGTMAVYNPESNMGNAVGYAPVLPLLNHGILLGLGTDAYTQDMFESLKVSNLIQKHELENPNIGLEESMAMLFQNNARICTHFFKKPLGVLKPGAEADIILLDYIPHTPMEAANLAGHVVFGLSGRCVDTVLVGGKFIMKDREIQTVDEEAVLAAARDQSAHFWKRLSS